MSNNPQLFLASFTLLTVYQLGFYSKRKTDDADNLMKPILSSTGCSRMLLSPTKRFMKISGS